MKYRWTSNTITDHELAEGQRLDEFLAGIEDSGWEIFQFVKNTGSTEVVSRRPREDG